MNETGGHGVSMTSQSEKGKILNSPDFVWNLELELIRLGIREHWPRLNDPVESDVYVPGTHTPTPFPVPSHPSLLFFGESPLVPHLSGLSHRIPCHYFPPRLWCLINTLLSLHAHRWLQPWAGGLKPPAIIFLAGACHINSSVNTFSPWS